VSFYTTTAVVQYTVAQTQISAALGSPAELHATATQTA